MFKMIECFVSSFSVDEEGLSFFACRYQAVSFTQKISKNQKRQFKRRRIIPTAFYDYLEAVGALPADYKVPREKRTEDQLMNILWEFKGRPAADCIREQLLLEHHPELRNKMGSQQHVWNALEQRGKEYGLKR